MTQPFIPEDRFCANPRCLIGRWSVTLHSAVNQVWRVISCYAETQSSTNGKPFLTALELETTMLEGSVAAQVLLLGFVAYFVSVDRPSVVG